MNGLKPYFVVLYTVVAITIAVIAALQIGLRGFSLIWFGTLLTVLPYVSFFAWARYLKKTPRTSPYLPIPTLITLAGVGLAIYGSVKEASVADSRFGLVAAVVAAVSFILYVNWYSIFNRRVNSKLTMGKRLPNFSVQDRDGNSVSSEVLLGKPALLLFYRGGWCPICMAHVDEVASRYRGLIERGVQIALISPQPPDLTRRVAELYDVAFNFWIDVDSAAAKALDILNENGVPIGLRNKYGADTVLPTVIIVDAEGKIIFTDQTDNYRVRPDPNLFIEALAVHGY
jgi:peroxiredoxin